MLGRNSLLKFGLINQSRFKLILLLFLFNAACERTTKKATDMMVPKTNAPEINTPYGWVNTDKSYSIKDFRGKFVLLDFWTFGCINCQHIVPDLKKLEEEFKDELVVIGVHSAKFTSEKSTQKIQKAIEKFGIEHPVVNDADFKVWDSYGVNAWPTVVLIDPDGKVIGQKSGEGVYGAVKPNLEYLVKQYKDKLSNKEINFNLQSESTSTLRFPSKLISDADGNIWISDSGHNRILKINTEGQVLLVIGNGKEGSVDSTFSESSFYEPHGLAIKDHLLYIADSKNNKIRVANLNDQTVKTAAGTGAMGYYYFEDKQNEPVDPNSPWDLLLLNKDLFVASAGNHQILRMDLNTHDVFRFAGTGREALADGSLKEAAFNQPSGLAKVGHRIFVADPEASAIREIDLKEKVVSTIIGKGLFDFGDKDGSFKDALLQHPVSIQEYQGAIYIADTYNGKIKVADLKNQKVKTIIKGLNEPNSLIFLNHFLFVTNTNDHSLLKFDLRAKKKEVIEVKF